MRAEEYKEIYLSETSHWWYRGMTKIMQTVIEIYYRQGSNLRILDAGCGTGYGMVLLSEYGNATGLDISPNAIRFCRSRDHKRLALASLMAIPFTDETFDLVTSLDVLYFEQVQDDMALREFFRVLVPGGRIILRVPAFDWLRGIHDVKVSTGHRYTLKELSGKMEKAGLHPELMSYSNTILFPLVVIKRLCEQWLPLQTSSDISINVGFFRKLFEYCLIIESRLITKWPLPFGVSLFAVGQKPF